MSHCRSNLCCRHGGLFAIFIALATSTSFFGIAANLNSDRTTETSAVDSADVQEPESKSDQAEDLDTEQQLQSFDQVWSTIKDSHWDPERVGESWDQARGTYRPKVEAAKSLAEVRTILQDLINELGQSHFGIIPADSYDVVDTEGGDGYCGLEIRLTPKGDAVVTRVDSGTPGDQAGIRPGWQVLRMGDREIADLIPKFEKAAHGPVRVETIAGMSLTRMASGEIGSKKEIQFVDANGEEQSIELQLVEQPGRESKLGNLPPMRVSFEQETLEEGIGYFRFNCFLDPVRVMPAYREVVSSEEHQRGMVIDLRGNVGGLAAMTMGMARPFVNEQKKLGTMYMKRAELNFAVFPPAEVYPGKVAVLVDECSISSAEILSGGLQAIGAARVFGNRTAGLALPSTVVKLPNGDGFQYAFANYISDDGKSLEGDGVVPDQKIDRTRELLLKESDPELSAAIKWIKTGSPEGRDSK